MPRSDPEGGAELGDVRVPDEIDQREDHHAGGVDEGGVEERDTIEFSREISELGLVDVDQGEGLA
jgi:hypothetical protein